MKKSIWYVSIGVLVILILVSLPNDDTRIATDDTTKVSSSSSVTRALEKPQPRGKRLLGMSVSEGAIGFEKSFALAQSIGVQTVELPISWDQYEPKPKEYDKLWLPVANQFYSNARTKLSLSLNPIDTNTLRLPADLTKKRLNDPEVIARYLSFVDFVSSELPDSDILFVSIGNEIDIYLGDSKAQWKDYADFFHAVAPHVRAKFPKAVIGSKMTFDVLMNANSMAKRIIDESDIVLVTYYPFAVGGFIVQNPDVVHDDFRRLTEMYREKYIYVAEIGYPSGITNGSSDEKQAEFVRQVFAVWDTFATNIPLVSFEWLHDKSPEENVGFQEYYGINDAGFVSFLGTLGLRTYDGEDKPAFTALQSVLKARGW